MNKKEFIDEVEREIKIFNGQIIQFIEDKKEFGNITLVLKIDEEQYVFETDKGEILLNNITIFSVFHDFEEKLSKYEKLLIAIKKTVSKV